MFFHSENYNNLCFIIVKEYERGIIYRLGRLRTETKGPGLFFINPFIEKYCILDLRLVSFVIPPQEILSKDSVTINIDAVVYFQVINVVKAINNVEDYEASTKLLSQTVLRNISGTKNLSELLVFKENISQHLQQVLDEATEQWGVKIHKVELKDICIPESMQRAMAIEGESSRKAKAKIIVANGEKEASNALKEAADIMSTNSSTMHLRYLQTLSHISHENTATIVFPFPIELMINLFQNLNNIKSSQNNTIINEY